jgi:hypothetical protein
MRRTAEERDDGAAASWEQVEDARSLFAEGADRSDSRDGDMIEDFLPR